MNCIILVGGGTEEGDLKRLKRPQLTQIESKRFFYKFRDYPVFLNNFSTYAPLMKIQHRKSCMNTRK